MRISDWSSDVCSSDLTGTATFAVTVSAGGGGRVTLGAGEQPVRIKTNARKYKARRGYKTSLIPSAPSQATQGPHGTDRPHLPEAPRERSAYLPGHCVTLRGPQRPRG